MAKLEQYQQAVQKLLQNYANFSRSDDEVETELIFNTNNNHYQLVHLSWQGDRRTYGCIVHLDIKGSRIWLQHNGTENDLAEELVAMGVPKTDIVIGFQSPFKRQFTEYAVS
jgi:XisI protein